MNQVQATSRDLAEKIGDIDPSILAGLVVALMQMVVSCLRRDEPIATRLTKIVTPEDVMNWLEAKDGPLGLRWIVRNVRRNRIAREIEFHCVTKPEFQNSKVDKIKEEFLKEIDSLTLEKMRGLYVNAGVV